MKDKVLQKEDLSDMVAEHAARQKVCVSDCLSISDCVLFCILAQEEEG